MTDTEKDIESIDIAIDAIEKIGRVMAYCNSIHPVDSDNFFYAGQKSVAMRVLEILEEKA